MQVFSGHRFNGRKAIEQTIWERERTVNRPRVDSLGPFEHRLNQFPLEGVELPVRHPLPTVAHVDRQELTRLDLVDDPATRLARQLGVVRHRKVVGGFERFQQLQAFALYL